MSDIGDRTQEMLEKHIYNPIEEGVDTALAAFGYKKYKELTHEEAEAPGVQLIAYTATVTVGTYKIIKALLPIRFFK